MASEPSTSSLAPSEVSGKSGKRVGGPPETHPTSERLSSLNPEHEELDAHPAPDEHKAQEMRKYLVQREDNTDAIEDQSAMEENALSMNASTFSRLDGKEDEYRAPHHTQGGAITEDLYRWAHQKRPRAKRTASMHEPSVSGLDSSLHADFIKQPGGFRRSYILSQAAEQGKQPPRAMRSFVEFLMRK